MRVQPRTVWVGMVTVAFIVAIVGFTLPWVQHEGASLRMNANDLAEWTSLHPQVSAQTPALFTTFILRLSFSLVAVLFAMQSFRSVFFRFLTLGVLVLISIAQLPPFEFITAFDNPNYSQQTMIAIGTLIFGILAWNFHQKASLIRLGLAVATCISIVVGVLTTQPLMDSYQIQTTIGTGAMVASVAILMVLGLNYMQNKQGYLR